MKKAAVYAIALLLMLIVTAGFNATEADVLTDAAVIINAPVSPTSFLVTAAYNNQNQHPQSVLQLLG
ncbi:MAG: hypothetical protein FWG30_06075 [Eubacteriaceae bacterium]|nr:hypothetical protein [Eubacteriaceae bacterium]